MRSAPSVVPPAPKPPRKLAANKREEAEERRAFAKSEQAANAIPSKPAVVEEKVLRAAGAASVAQAKQEAEENTNWWEKTKSFVNNTIIQPANTYIYQPIVQPAIEQTKANLASASAYLDTKLYQPYIKPKIEEIKQDINDTVAVFNEKVYQPYIQPKVEKAKEFAAEKAAEFNEKIYQPIIKPTVERVIEQTKETLSKTVAAFKENIYQPFIQPVAVAAYENIYQPFIQPAIQKINESIVQPIAKPALENFVSLIEKGANWVNDNIYQPVFAPVVNDINKYIYQPLAEKAQQAWDKYGEWVHGSLDAAGLIPGFGEIADGLNGLIYLGEGRYLEAAISAAAMIPILGDLGKAGKWTIKLGKETVEVVFEAATKAAVKNIAEEATEEAVEKAVKELAELGMEKTSKRLLGAATEEAAEYAIEKGAKEAAWPAIKNAAEEMGEKIQVDTVQDVARKSVDEYLKNSAPKAAKDAAEDALEKSIKKDASTTVEQALQNATLTRTNTGAVNQESLAKLLDDLPEVKLIGASADDNLQQFVAKSLDIDASEIVLTPIAGGGAKGVSGAPVITVANQAGDSIGISKLFPDTEGFARELSALQRLKAEGFDLVGSPDILGAGKAVLPGGEGGLLITSLAPGKGLDDFMDIGKLSGQPRVDAFDNLKNAISKNAEALAELHTKPLGSGGPVASEYLDQHVKALKEIADKIQSNPKFSDIPNISQLREQLDSKVDDLINGLKKDPGGSALVHGDAHPGNFFYDPEKGITLIDTPTLHSSMDAMGNPIGIPARDFGNFDQKLANLGKRFDLKPDEITELQATFRQSYQLAGGPSLSNESLSFFRTRAALGELSKFDEIAGSDATPQEIKAVGAQLFELAMKALGN